MQYVKSSIQTRLQTKIPIILTIRNDESEGGKTTISDDRKYEIFSNVISMIDAVDIELSSPILSKVVKLAKDNTKIVVISSHNFNKTASDDKLEEILENAKSQGADIVKIAMQANSLDDVKRLASFTLKNRDKNIITISLGSVGSISRLTFPSMGSLLTYSYIGKESAPGQLPLIRLQDDLRLYYPDYNQYLIEKYELLEFA